MAIENLWLPDLFIKDVDQAPLGLWLMSTVKVTSDMINQGGWSASVTWHLLFPLG